MMAEAAVKMRLLILKIFGRISNRKALSFLVWVSGRIRTDASCGGTLTI
jgi:hypothetical protein